MAWRIKCPPARPRIGESPGGGGSSSLGGQGVPGDGEGRCGPGGGGVWRRGPSAPRPAKQKAEAGGKASGLSFSGRFAPRRRPPLGNRDAIPLAPETWRMRQEKGEVSAKTPPAACRKTSGEWKIAALLGFNRIWRHVRQIRKKPCVARVSLHSSLAAP